ncbi:MAG: ParB/RepB/Spo0J family partition protein [Phormidesmis sp.]
MSNKNNKKESFSLAGRGILGGLVSNESVLSQDIENAAEWVAINKIVKSPLQPRQFFDQSSIDSLSDAFKKHGFRGALNVRPLDKNTYELVAGERRWRAAQQANLKTVRCIVDDYTDEQALEFALMENLQRENLSKLEETEGILKFIEVKLGIERDRAVNIVRTEGHSDKSARSYVAPSDEIKQIEELLSLFDIGLQTFRTKHLRTLALPDDLKQAHLNQGLSYSSAIELSKVKDDQERCDLLADVLQEDLSFRATKERVREVLSPDKKSDQSQSLDIAKRFTVIARQVKKTPSLLGKSQNRKRIEKLLKELESLISEE